ncbi:MAG TPA: hypothetical protein DCR96_01250 [Hyphomonas sp.]|uniref:hypothetical protein n=1 Tax=unclassified Hyphomonas TaxID=2630699 RepID=UPI000C5365EB|nr:MULTISPECIES: hypothetical protein [unclassified Hyphomonas]MAA81657.1 hypothetical protein [Hyphomonas sp.]MAN90400.1 hypothetical protein [Hyphomonadaceae bacterium]HAQ75092.1 hypothetical protein [Hyphomonas sp.]HCN93226.1 hypothetical protein [Hyphomonas sp.]|tara:strand:+ start:4427 stop:4966 length:540 start_codon:yes stop_codon:yes gene_type:complete
MHIVILILGILTTIGIWSWRIQMARRGAKVAMDAARTLTNTPRRFAFKYKAGRNGIGLIEDPREAAAVMMMEVARGREGPLTERQARIIDDEMMQNFSFTQAEADELSAHAAWVTNSAPDPQRAMRKLSELIVSSPQLGPKEIVDLDAMLVAVSEAEGVPTREQLALLQVFRDKAGLKT